MSVVNKFDADGFYVRHLLNCETYIQTSYGLFIANMLITGDDHLTVYHLKKNHVPNRLQAFGVTDSSIASTVVGWFDYARDKRYLSTLKELFPRGALHVDFDRQNLTDQLELDVTELQAQVAALDATYSLDSERLVAIQNLQTQIDSNDVDIAAEISDRQGAITAEQSARAAAIDVEKVRAEAEEKAIQDDVDANQLAGDTDRALIRSEFGAEDLLLKSRLNTLEQDPTTKAYVDAVQSDVDANELAGDTDRALIRTEFAAEDLLLKGRLDTLESDPVTQGAVTTQISAATDSLISAAPQQLQTLNALAAAIGDDVAHVSTITAAIALKSDKVSPVFSGTHAVFQAGLEFSNSASCQGQHFVGNNSITVRSIGDANVSLSAPGTGVVTCDSNFEITGVCKQNGNACLDTSSSIVSDVAGKQVQLTTAQLAVCAGEAFSSSLYTLSATIDSERAAAVEVEKLRAEAAEGTKQVQLTTPELAVIAGDAFDDSLYTLSATIDTERAAAVLVEKLRAEAAEATKQALLGSGALDILTGEKYTSAEQTKVAAITSIGSGAIMTVSERTLLSTTHADLHVAHSSALSGKQDLLNTTHLAIDTSKSHVGIREQNPETILEIPYKNSDDKCVWLGHRGLNQAGNVATDTADAEHRTLMLGSRPSGAWATLGFQVQNTDKATIDYNAGQMSFYIFDSSTSAWDLALQLRKDGEVFMPNLPTSITGLAAGQLWNNGGIVNVKQ